MSPQRNLTTISLRILHENVKYGGLPPGVSRFGGARAASNSSWEDVQWQRLHWVGVPSAGEFELSCCYSSAQALYENEGALRMR